MITDLKQFHVLLIFKHKEDKAEEMRRITEGASCHHTVSFNQYGFEPKREEEGPCKKLMYDTQNSRNSYPGFKKETSNHSLRGRHAVGYEAQQKNMGSAKKLTWVQVPALPLTHGVA